MPVQHEEDADAAVERADTQRKAEVEQKPDALSHEAMRGVAVDATLVHPLDATLGDQGMEMEAYREALERTSMEWAPWYIVPADHKWYRDLVIATTLERTLEALPLSYPQPEESLGGLEIT